MNNRVYQQHFPRKRFGQHFLTNDLFINRIVSAIHPKKEEAIIEIGPGLGALTKPISECVDCMTVIELDRDLVAWLLKNLPLKKKLIIYQKDAMTVNFYNIAKEAGQLLRVVGNLPYNISTPLMFYLFNYSQVILDMHFMLQKEVVNRLVAKPNSKAYGRLGIMAQYYCKIMVVLEVPPTSFTPEPKVDSALVRLVPHRIMPDFVSDIRMLGRITGHAFKKRRKTIRNSLGELFTPMQLISLGIDPSLRAENISISQYCKLANWLSVNSALQQ